MRNRILQLALLLLFSAPAWATWTSVQFVTDSTNTAGHCGAATTTTCTATITSSTSGNVLIAEYDMLGASSTITSITASCGGTWVHTTNNPVNQSTNFKDIWYNLTSTGGCTTIQANLSVTGSGRRASVWELHSDAGLAFSAVSDGATRASSITPLGLALTVSSLNCSIIQGITTAGGTITSLDTSYVLDTNSNTRAAGHLFNVAVGTAPTWTLNLSEASGVNAVAVCEGTATPATTSVRVITF